MMVYVPEFQYQYTRLATRAAALILDNQSLPKLYRASTNFGQKMLQNYCILIQTKAFPHFPRMGRWCLMSQILLNSLT